MLSLKELHKKLETSKELKDFEKKNEKAFLYSCFFVSEGKWQFDYYNPEDNNITSFEAAEKIKEMPIDSLVNKKAKITELNLNNIKIECKKAVEAAKEFMTKNYPSDISFMKEIIILENNEGKPVWNLTFLTATLKLVNIKVDGENGKIITHSSDSFLKMR